VPAGTREVLDRTAVEEPAVVEDPDPVADLGGDLKDVGGEEDGPAVPNVLLQKILDRPLYDGVQVDQRLVDEGEPWFVEERLRKHQFLPGAPREVLAEDISFVLEVQQVEPAVAPLVDAVEVPDAGHEVEVLFGGEEAWGVSCSGMIPTSPLTPTGSFAASSSITRAVPEVGGICPVSIRIIVVLPDPFGPRRPKSFTSPTENETLFTAATLP
jgi:hypothetical protein